MGLNLFPARVPIGKATARDGAEMNVLMTVEFSRALAAILDRIGGPDGVSTTELAKLIKELQLQATLLVEQITALSEQAAALAVAVEDQTIIGTTTIDQVGADHFAEAQMDGLGASMTRLGARLDDIDLQQSLLAPSTALAQQLADVATMLALHEEPPPLQKNTVTGAKGGNAALTSLLAALAKSGIITDLTT